MLGIVDKYYARPRGKKLPYGFIEAFDGEKYYFNKKGQKEEVSVGDEVSFRGMIGDKGGFATGVQKNVR